MKVTTIQETARWEDKSVAQFMGSLHTHELKVLFDELLVSSKKGKLVVFTIEE